MRHQKPASPDSVESRKSFAVRHDFDDVDELADVARSWDVDFRQLNRGRFRGRLLQAGTSGMQLGRVRLQGVVHQNGAAPPGHFSFAIPVQSHIDLVWRHRRIEQNQVIVYQPSGEIECASQEDFEVLIVTVSETALERGLERAGQAVNRRLLAGLEVAQVSGSVMSALRRWIASALITALEDPDLMGRPTPADGVETEASDLLARCLAPGLVGPSRRRPTRRRRLVEEAVNLARDHAHEIATVAELSRVSGTSERTLRRGFQERFGTSPKAYLQAQRLVGVRRALRERDPSTAIADIANRWGFWHMGQFAADYRRHFGELPSETVANASGRST